MPNPDRGKACGRSWRPANEYSIYKLSCLLPIRSELVVGWGEGTLLAFLCEMPAPCIDYMVEEQVDPVMSSV
ncbi:hypothetical protein HaLaN_16549, partial [Haematococcus lacustris]